MGVSCRSIMKMAAASIAVCALTWAAPALAAPQNGWVESGGERYWYDDGVMARDKQVHDPASDAWYWFDADGTMAADKDVFVPVSNEDRSQGKWCATTPRAIWSRARTTVMAAGTTSTR